MQLKLLILLFIAGLAIRLETLASRPLWYDEVFTHDVVKEASSLGELWSISKRDGAEHPPLFYAAAWISSRVGGVSEFSLRLPSMLAGVAAVLLAAIVAGRIFSPEAGTISALLLAFSPYAIDYSQEARSYMLLVCELLAVFWLLQRFFDTTRFRYFVGAGAVYLAALYTHHLALFAIPALIVHYLTGIRTIENRGRAVRDSIITVFFLALLYAPQYRLFQGYQGGPNADPKHLLSLSLPVLVEIAGKWSGSFGVAFLLFTFVGAVMVGVRNHRGIFLLVLLVTPFLVFGLRPFSKFFDIRFLIAAYPAFIILAAGGISYLLKVVSAKASALWPGAKHLLPSLVLAIILAPAINGVILLRSSSERCHNFFYRPELLDSDNGFCARYLILNSLNSRYDYLLEPR